VRISGIHRILDLVRRKFSVRSTFFVNVSIDFELIVLIPLFTLFIVRNFVNFNNIFFLFIVYLLFIVVI